MEVETMRQARAACHGLANDVCADVEAAGLVPLPVFLEPEIGSRCRVCRDYETTTLHVVRHDAKTIGYVALVWLCIKCAGTGGVLLGRIVRQGFRDACDELRER